MMPYNQSSTSTSHEQYLTKPQIILSRRIQHVIRHIYRFVTNKWCHLKNVLQFYFLAHPDLRSFWQFIQRYACLKSYANQQLTNLLIDRVHSPRMTTTQPPLYVTWDGLTPYSYRRYLPPTIAWSYKSLDVESVIDQLFLRQGEGVKSETSSLLLAYMAQWFTEGFLRSVKVNGNTDLSKSLSNHQVDLSLVYGWNPAMTNCLRSHVRGELKSQWINGEEYPPYYFDQATGQPKPEFYALDMSDILQGELREGNPRNRVSAADRLKLFAMGGNRSNFQVGTLMFNILFLREHNRICRRLAQVYTAWDDERLFQTARNIAIVLLIKLVIEEYINHIAPYHFNFVFDPSAFHNAKWYKAHHDCRVSIELNLLYRWHSMVPDYIYSYSDQPEKQPIAETQWKTDLVVDRGLGILFDAASTQPAMALQLLNTPSFLKHAEMNSLKQSRSAHLASYNDYRELCGLSRVSHFEEITTSPTLQKRLRNLYQHPDHLEFYVGLFAEDRRPNSPLPPLLSILVASEAFTKLLSNPLLAQEVYCPETFSEEGWRMIHTEDHSLSSILHRNLYHPGSSEPTRKFHVSLAIDRDANV